MNLRKQLRFYLDQRGWTAASLAKKAGVPKASLNGWLAGSIPRDVRQLKKVSDLFGITLDHLLFGEGAAKSPETFTDLGQLLGQENGNWIGGVFEVRIRKLKKSE